MLKSTVARLDDVTNGYSRLKTITSHTKNFELVSEQDIASAQVEVAREVEPQLFKLTEKCTDTIKELEEEEKRLAEQIQLETDKQKQRVHRQKTARSGLSNIKKLQSLTRRKDELSRSATELDEVLEQKRQEFSQLMERANQIGPSKRTRRYTSHESRELALKEEERKKEVARRDQELKSIQQKIEDKRRDIQQLRSKADSLNNSDASGHDGFNPTLPWTMYSHHHNVLEQVLQTDLEVEARDHSVYEETFARVITPYLRELDSRQAKTDKELNKLTRDKTKRLSQMRNLCKQLFPEENIGHTMVRVLELLVESPSSELYYQDLVQNEFPVEEERRHNLSRVVAILKQVGVIEVVVESREEGDNEDEQDGEPRRTGEQLVIRIKFEDSG
ncbi:hypothetical protein BGX34_004822 [Mortierella sp. NVP85]|nr:hypothetical protein BGX34_004822 [Mortierella sp. NVP85]